MILHNVLLWFQHVKVIGHFRVNTGPVLLLLLSLLQRTFLIVPQREVSDTCMTLHTLHTGLPLYLHLFVTNWQFSIRINPGRIWMENLKPVFICWKSIVFISHIRREQWSMLLSLITFWGWTLMFRPGKWWNGQNYFWSLKLNKTLLFWIFVDYPVSQNFEELPTKGCTNENLFFQLPLGCKMWYMDNRT